MSVLNNLQGRMLPEQGFRGFNPCCPALCSWAECSDGGKGSEVSTPPGRQEVESKGNVD